MCDADWCRRQPLSAMTSTRRSNRSRYIAGVWSAPRANGRCVIHDTVRHTQSVGESTERGIPAADDELRCGTRYVCHVRIPCFFGQRNALGLIVVALISLGGCRAMAPLTPAIATAPNTPARAPRTPSTPVVVANRDSATRPPRDSATALPQQPQFVEPNSDEITRAVTGMFGDSLLMVRRPVSSPRRGLDSVVVDSTAPDSATDDGDSDAPTWDIDVRSYETHERVARYVKLFTQTGRAGFQTRLSRGTRYEPMIRSKLRDAGMPEDLYFLPLIESGYEVNAYSRAAAVGMWQFMTSTGKEVGLTIDWWVDERRDPVKSTDAAIRFLRDLQEQFGSLYLAAAAYNGGPGRVSRGLKRFADELEGTDGEDRFFALAEQSFLPSDTKNYVPQIIAAALAGKSPQRYGMAVDTLPPLRYDSLWVAAGVPLASVAKAADIAPKDIAELNPHILRGVTPPAYGWWVRVPEGVQRRTEVRLAQLPASDRVAFTATSTRSKETVTALASRMGVSSRAVTQFNPGLRTGRRGRLVAGQKVRIPTAATLATFRDVPDPSIERYGGVTRSASSSGPGSARAPAARIHIVKRGEVLGRIALRYGTTVARLKSLNGMRRDRLFAGQALLVSAGSRPASASAGKASVKSRATKSVVVAGKKRPAASPAKKGAGKAAAKSGGRKAPPKKAPPKKPAANKRPAPRR
jgi:membrane-bound lytic murein transglycosylase D